MQFPFDQSLMMPNKYQASNDMYQQWLTSLIQKNAADETLKQQKIISEYLPANEQAGLNQTRAGTAQTQLQTQLMPNDQTIKEQMAYNDAGKLSQSQNRFNTITQLSSYVKSTVGQSQLAKDPAFAASVQRVMSGLASDADWEMIAQKTGQPSSYQNNLMQNLLPGFAKLVKAPGYAIPANPQTPQSAPQAMPPQQMPQGAPQGMPQQTGAPSPALNPQQVRQLLAANPNQAAQLGITVPQGAPQQPQVQNVPQVPTAAPSPITNPQVANAGAQNAQTPQFIKSPIQAAQPSADIINQGLQSSAVPQEQANKIAQDMQTQIEDIMEKKATPTAILNQRYYANTMNGLMQRAAPYLPSIYKYTGFEGKIRLNKDKFVAATGFYTSPDLSNYNAFQSVIKPSMSSELRKKLGAQATDQEISKWMSVVDPSRSWFGNKDIAQAQMHALQDVSNTTDAALAQGPAASRANLLIPQSAIQPSQVPQVLGQQSTPDIGKNAAGEPTIRGADGIYRTKQQLLDLKKQQGGK